MFHHREHRGRREESRVSGLGSGVLGLRGKAPTPAAQAKASNDRPLTALQYRLDRMHRTPNIGILIMATAAIAIGLTSRSLSVLNAWEQYPAEVANAVNAAIGQILPEVETFIKANKLSGQSAKVRSGALRQDLTHKQTDPLGGHVGTTSVTSAYARTILGPGPTTIKPVNAKYLWVPIADNLNPSGVARLTPREALELTTPDGKRRLQVFTSKAGNLVAFLPDIDEDGNTKRFKRKTKGGRKKGDLKGKLLFVLKDEVTIEGTDALAQGAQEMSTRATIIFNTKLQEIKI